MRKTGARIDVSSYDKLGLPSQAHLLYSNKK